METMTVREMFEAMPGVFRPEKAKGVQTVIQFRLSGEGGGDWYLTVEDGTCTVTEGVTDAAKATISMSAKDYIALAMGKLGGIRGYMTGRIKVSGDVMLLQKMQSWFPEIGELGP